MDGEPAERIISHSLDLGDKPTIINSTHDPDSFKDTDNHLRISIKDDKRLVTFN